MCADRLGDLGWTRELQRRCLRDGKGERFDVYAAMAMAHRLGGDGRQRQAMNTVVSALSPSVPGSARHTLLTSGAARIAEESGLAARRVIVRRAVRDAARERAGRPWVPSSEDDGSQGDWRAVAYGYAAAATAGPPGPVTDAAALFSDTGATSVERLITEGWFAFHLDRQGIALERFGRALRSIDSAQAGGLFREICLPYASALVDAGRWQEAADVSLKGYELAVVQRDVLATVKIAAVRARLLALVGQDSEAKALLEDLPAVDFTENRAAQALILRARVILERFAGRLRRRLEPSARAVRHARQTAAPGARLAQRGRTGLPRTAHRADRGGGRVCRRAARRPRLQPHPTTGGDAAARRGGDLRPGGGGGTIRTGRSDPGRGRPASRPRPAPLLPTGRGCAADDGTARPARC